MKRGFNIGRVQRRSFDKTQSMPLGERFRLIRRHGPQVSQVRLVPNQHYYNVLVCVVSEFLVFVNWCLILGFNCSY